MYLDGDHFGIELGTRSSRFQQYNSFDFVEPSRNLALPSSGLKHSPPRSLSMW